MNGDDPSRLDAPGAGLPKLELLVAKVIFGRWRKSHSRGEVDAVFEEERGRMLALAEGCGAEKAARQVLIKRLRGMEDSSRNWSVYMTLEHVRIVNAGICGCIRSLAAGRVPPGTASTAAVKPAPGIGPEVLGTFSEGCGELVKAVEGVGDLRTTARYAHPWFGPLDAAGWHAVAAFHMRLHRKQVEEILRGM